MLLMVVLAQEDRARVSDYFYLCPGHATSVARNPAVHAHAGHVFSHSHGGTLRRGDVVPEDSHGQSLQRLMQIRSLIQLATAIAATPQ